MEFKKKTIIGEDNNEPPKDYIGIKSDGKAYEYSYVSKKGVESKSISGSGNCEPVEANPTIEDGDVTTPLNALKVGESVYTVGGDSDSDIQIVELTYDHIPATGTLSASDLAKLDSDNCLLVMKGKYFRKTFSSDGGIDYKEIGLATVLGGVRSIYFTASKPDGEYTIAYTHPIEANTQTQATTALENIKVGNTTYSVPLSPMIVEGVVNLDDSPMTFTPGEGAPTFAEARDQMLHGGLVYFMFYDNDEPFLCLASTLVSDGIHSCSYNELITWNSYQTFTVNGVLSADFHRFTPDGSDEMSWADAKQAFDDGDHILLNDSNRGLALTVSDYDSETYALITEPYNGVAYSWFGPQV